MKNYKYLIMILLLLLNVAAEATLVTLASGEHDQTLDGQDFTFIFNVPEVLPSDGKDGILTIKARGDYALNDTRFENIRITINDDTSVDYGPVGATGPYGTPGSNLLSSSYNEFDDNEWKEVFDVLGVDLERWTTGGSIKIFVDLSAGVNLGLATQIPDTQYVDVTLQYSAVPIPLSIWLFATGIFSLFGVRRLTAKSA